jgi:hypothetical protein
MATHTIQRIVVNGSGPNSGEALIRVADENQNYQSFFMFAPQTHQTNDFLDLLSTAFEKMWTRTNIKIAAHEYNGDQVVDDIEDA